MTQKPVVSIVMGAYNRLEFLKLAIESARTETKAIPHEIIVVDGGSDDGSIEWLALQKDVLTIIQHNRGIFNDIPIQRRSWGYFMNLVFKSAQADYILMMSDDTIFHENAVQAGLDFIKEQTAQGKKVGAVPFYFHDIAFDDPHEYKVHTLLNVPMLNHGIYLREAFAGVGFADEDQYQFYGADNDICLKLVHAGYEIVPCKTALMLHCPNHPTRYMTTSSKQWVQDATALLAKWRGIFVDEHVKVEDLSLVNWFVTYQDPTNLAKTFDAALSAAAKTDSDPTATHTTDMAVRIEYIDSRLNNVLSAIRYNIQLTEQYHRDWLQIRHYDNKPLYWRILATWAIFKPLRDMKKRFFPREIRTVDAPKE